jgi:hypothetical protein
MPNRIEATLRKPRQQPPGDYSHCACSRLHPSVRPFSGDFERSRDFSPISAATTPFVKFY